ncbi:amino acid ABC transporter substrate-binding protein (PAAT family) [Kribbella voronezhensis]|uniref:Amino acid ABC transporter substrate-binding protein (PAAT family) n=1 Tax=Kribbella voronezhensis TaxID=2512212 RepID=A0A4R7TIU1_9ACTN|nr:ABC transporter substrate-binding protein [Kribbella voronezhensis]TDU91889.1 amino acid ABC transporter substrate-binding protein (PAAT family) [Kribbella voronezhensis]
MRAFSALRRLAALGTAVTLVVALAACGSDDKSSGGPDLGLLQAGTLRIGTLTDAPPNVYVKDGKFTGFDNDLITAVAAKLNLKPEFVGTDFSALLSQVNGGQFDLGSSSITITEARKKTVAFSNGYDFGYLGLNTTKTSGITSFDQLAGKRVVVVQGTVQDDYATSKNLNPVRVPNYNAAVGQLKAGTADAWISPAEIGEKMAKEQGGGVVILAAKELSSAPTAYAVAKSNDKLREAVNKALDEVIADGTWTKLVQQYYPGRAVPASFKPGSGTVKFTPPSAG